MFIKRLGCFFKRIMACRGELLDAQAFGFIKRQKDRQLKEKSWRAEREENANSDTNLERRHIDDVRLEHTPNADVPVAQIGQPGELSS